MTQDFSKCHPDCIHSNNLGLLFVKFIFSLPSSNSGSKVERTEAHTNVSSIFDKSFIYFNKFNANNNSI